MKSTKKRAAKIARLPALTILLFEHAGAWLAQALERDIASTGTTPHDAIVGLVASVTVHVGHDARARRKPLSQLPRAPARFFQLAKQAWPTSPPRLPRKIGGYEPRVRLVSDDDHRAAASV